MKKLLNCFVVGFLVLLLAGLAWADSVTQSVTMTGRSSGGERDYVYQLSWTAAADGSLTSVTTEESIDGYVYMVVTDPGTTAPQALYDLTLTDAYGLDIMGGALADRSATVTQQAFPALLTGVYGSRRVNGRLTLNLTNNNVNAATGVVDIFFYRD